MTKYKKKSKIPSKVKKNGELVSGNKFEDEVIETTLNRKTSIPKITKEIKVQTDLMYIENMSCRISSNKAMGSTISREKE